MCYWSAMRNSLQWYGPQPASLHHPWDFSARILEWVAISSSRGSSQPRGRTCISCIIRWILGKPIYTPGKPHIYTYSCLWIPIDSYTDAQRRSWVVMYTHTYIQNPSGQANTGPGVPSTLVWQVVEFINPLPVCMPKIEALFCPHSHKESLPGLL